MPSDPLNDIWAMRDHALNDCRCSRIKIDSEVTEHRNWNPDCPEHGVMSEWYRSPEQVATRQAQNDRLRELQRQAREARQRHA